ncbi:FAD:protein FMN transferase [Cellulomonas sp. PhB150]|uniref:FAD:protein FMN transferase n=1 Tax=Cellulomonas sp. PhB150 TaxID=2485188 RepID=UPI000F4921FB|nr:FAD:protein FMN transferase [Cellulomonas sp. PhB150]
MGIPMSLDVPGARREDVWGLVTDAFEQLHAANRQFSRFDPGSEVSRYGRGEVAPDDLSDELREVLAVAERASADSGGAFSVRRPDGSLDTDGVVKGWAAQRAVDVLRAGGLSSFCLNAGGDVAAAGEPEPGRGWSVGVRHPADAERVLAVLEVRDGAVATSGLYERGHHVWDGRTGETATELVAATVVAGDLMTADVLATTVLALGPPGVEWAHAHGAAAVIAVLPDGRVLTGGAARQAVPA